MVPLCRAKSVSARERSYVARPFPFSLPWKGFLLPFPLGSSPRCRQPLLPFFLLWFSFPFPTVKKDAEKIALLLPINERALHFSPSILTLLAVQQALFFFSPPLAVSARREDRREMFLFFPTPHVVLPFSFFLLPTCDEKPVCSLFSLSVFQGLVFAGRRLLRRAHINIFSPPSLSLLQSPERYAESRPFFFPLLAVAA